MRVVRLHQLKSASPRVLMILIPIANV
jgi:hypothetical protein